MVNNPLIRPYFPGGKRGIGGASHVSKVGS